MFIDVIIVFLNLIRLKDDDEGAANTDVVETTQTAKQYAHRENSKIVFWDFPGTGMNK